MVKDLGFEFWGEEFGIYDLGFWISGEYTLGGRDCGSGFKYRILEFRI